MLYTSCILQTRWGFCDYRSQIHEQYAIICRVTFSIVNYEFATHGEWSNQNIVLRGLFDLQD